MTRRIALVSVLMLALFTLSFTVAQAAQGSSDSAITANVESALSKALGSNTTGTNSFRIDVKTTDGIVTLNGDVREASTKTKAVRTATSVKGVKSVVDNITVKSGN